MATRIAWLLNLDAELELADPKHYRPSAAMQARIARLRERMQRLLLPDDRIIGVDRDPGACSRALAFCPTPQALARIDQAECSPPPAPPLAVLARVNSRAFSAELGQTLERATFVRSMDELLRALNRAPDSVWLLKREFAFAGRERRLVHGAALDPPTHGFARRSFQRGEGLQLEPLLRRTADFAQHGYALGSGRVLVGAPSAQDCDEKGRWQSSRELADDELDPGELRALQASCQAAGEALVQAGYFGPFGVDAYRFEQPDGRPSFQPRSEINARFSMGYPRALLERALRCDEDPSGA
jgi:hypothetical protein